MEIMKEREGGKGLKTSRFCVGYGFVISSLCNLKCIDKRTDRIERNPVCMSLNKTKNPLRTSYRTRSLLLCFGSGSFGNGRRNNDGGNGSNRNRNNNNDDDDDDNERKNENELNPNALLYSIAFSTVSNNKPDYYVARRTSYNYRNSQRSSEKMDLLDRIKRITATEWLLLINVVVHALDNLVFKRGLLMVGAIIPAQVQKGELWRLLCAPFLHINNSHLLVNCLSLRNMGAAVQRTLGTDAVPTLYLLGGILSSIASAALHRSNTLSAGASGAIFAMLGAYRVMLYLNREYLKAPPSLEMMVLFNLALGFVPGSGIDNIGHIAGFLSGLGLGWALSPRIQMRKSIDGRLQLISDQQQIPAYRAKSYIKSILTPK